MNPFSSIRRIFNDPIVRGFILTTLILLGVGLERSLLNEDTNQIGSCFFLLGNILGYPVGIWIWRFYPKSKLPLYFWQIESCLIAFTLLKGKIFAPFLFFVIGLFFPLLLIHLFLLMNSDLILKNYVKKIGIGILIGNILLFFLAKFSYPLNIIWLCIAIASWRIKRPEDNPFVRVVNSSSFLDKTYFFFLISLLFFYTIGGLYYNLLESFSFNSFIYFDELSYGLYILGIICTILLASIEDRMPPFLAISIMGCVLLFMMPPSSISPYGIGVMDFSFGIMDAYSIAFMFFQASSFFELALGLSLYPLAILLNIISLRYGVIERNIDIKLSLIFLFLTLIPLSLFTKKRFYKKKTSAILALPPSEKNKVKEIKQIPNDEEKLNRSFDPEITQIATIIGLSDREKDVFYKLIKEKKLKEIAQELNLALGTVKALSSRIYEKAEVKNRIELKNKVNPKKS
ncbi:LuxR C-terminal-related transcriptional regulator [Desulfothermus naphthae]